MSEGERRHSRTGPLVLTLVLGAVFDVVFDVFVVSTTSGRRKRALPVNSMLGTARRAFLG